MPHRILGIPWKTLGGFGGGMLGSPSGGLGPVAFLFRDDFTTAEGAPMASPRTMEPGPGTGVLRDTGNNLSIVGGRLRSAGAVAAADPTYNDNTARDRVTGLCVYAINNVSNRTYFGWDDALGGTINRTGVQFLTAANLIGQDQGDTGSLATLAPNTDYEQASIVRSTGGFQLIRGTAQFPEWELLWVGFTDTTDPLYAGIARRTGGATQHDNFRGTLLPSPWSDDYGIATQRLAGARAPGDTFTHEANCLIEFTMTTVPAAAQAELHFRIQDATNYWAVTVNSAGDLELDEVVAGVTTQRGVSAGVVANGDRIVIVADASNIRVYEDDNLRINYTLAATFLTETAGELDTEGTGGAVDDLISWPRVLSGSALTTLNRVADA